MKSAQTYEVENFERENEIDDIKETHVNRKPRIEKEDNDLEKYRVKPAQMKRNIQQDSFEDEYNYENEHKRFSPQKKKYVEEYWNEESQSEIKESKKKNISFVDEEDDFIERYRESLKEKQRTSSGRKRQDQNRAREKYLQEDEDLKELPIERVKKSKLFEKFVKNEIEGTVQNKSSSSYLDINPIAAFRGLSPNQNRKDSYPPLDRSQRRKPGGKRSMNVTPQRRNVSRSPYDSRLNQNDTDSRFDDDNERNFFFLDCFF